MRFLIQTVLRLLRRLIWPMALAPASLLAGMALAFSLVSCGGGADGVSGGGTGGGSPSRLPGSNPASSFGPVTGLGSIFVGSYEFDDALQKVTAQDELPVRAGDLGLGVHVSVLNDVGSQSLSLNAENPTSGIQIKRMFLGKLETDGSNAERLLLNGQTVFTDRRTVLVGTSQKQTLIGSMVLVSGYLEPTFNHVIATRIEPASPDQLAQRQIYLSARVQTVDLTRSIASVGFASISMADIQMTEPVRVGDFIRVQGSFVDPSAAAPVVMAAKLAKLKVAAGNGNLTFRGIVYSRPSNALPAAPLVIDGYEIQLAAPDQELFTYMRQGSVVEVSGQIENVRVINAKVRVIANPRVTLPGEEEALALPATGRQVDAPEPDYLIYQSPVQSVNSDGTFVVRGLRVRLFAPLGIPVPTVAVGQIVSVEGEAKFDASGLYISALFSARK